LNHMTVFDDYSAAIQNLIGDITRRVHELSYIDPDKVSVILKRSRSKNDEGVWAEVTGLEPEGESLKLTHGRTERFFTSKSLLLNGNMVKYVIEFYVPRFINLPFMEKIITVFHELYHISPKFDGNLRFFSGKNYMHGDSIERYDLYMEYLVSKYLQTNSDYVEFLKHNYENLRNKAAFKTLGTIVPKPELFRITWA
ncbi:MAG: hypothetical protein JXA66_01835, partial [Oligoflexia bacterium]|nr:hypothetical protein [Oligoflexia bacterium]